MRPDTFPVPALLICMDAIDLECVQACMLVQLIYAMLGCKQMHEMGNEICNSGVRLDYVCTQGLFLCSSLLFGFSGLVCSLFQSAVY